MKTSLTAIFFDLDETLIHAQEERPAMNQMVTPVMYGPYHVWLRTSARELLTVAKATRLPLFLCTTSERLYASGISNLFELGFTESQILSLEHLQVGETDLAPNSILIDDLPSSDPIAALKMRMLGITTERYFQVPPFTASSRIQQREQYLIDQFQTFLKQYQRSV